MPASNLFTPVNFSEGQILDEDTLDQLNSNSVYLRDQSIDGKYTVDWGGVWDTNIKLMCGRIYIPPQAVAAVYGTVAFTNMFTPGSQPMIVTSILSPGQNKFTTIHYGIGQYFPDHRGFQFKINVHAGHEDNEVFESPIYLIWHAMGI